MSRRGRKSPPAAVAIATAAPAVVHLPLSSAAPWPGLEEFRPPGWRSKLSPAQVAARLAEIDEARRTGAWTDDKLEREADRLMEHVKILRQSWNTRPEVWRFAEYFVGPPEIDPFWNVWSCIHTIWAGVRLLDGNEGRNGFDLSLWGKTSQTQWSDERQCMEIIGHPRTGYLNGPHDNASAYVSLSVHAHAAGHRVATVLPIDGCNWFAGAACSVDGSAAVMVDAMSCDVLAIPEGGRMSFSAAPGIKASSPNKGYALAMWGVKPEVMTLLFGERRDTHGAGGASVRVTFQGKRWILIRGCGDGGRTAEVRKLSLN